MIVEVNLPNEMIAQIDSLTGDRSAFVVDAVARALRDLPRQGVAQQDQDDDVTVLPTGT